MTELHEEILITIVLISAICGRMAVVPRAAVAHSDLLRDLVAAQRHHPDSPHPHKLYLYLDSDVLLTVAAFLCLCVQEALCAIPEPLPWPTRVADLVQAEYAAFLPDSVATAEELLATADYLGLVALERLCCAHLARLALDSEFME